MPAHEIFVPVKAESDVNAIRVGVEYNKRRGGIALSLMAITRGKNGMFTLGICDPAYRAEYILIAPLARLNNKKLARYASDVRADVARRHGEYWDFVTAFAMASKLTILDRAVMEA
jgi:hypothetical protein